MEEYGHITNVAKLFHIAPSALRYWDEAGLVRFERGADNNYRIPTVQTFLDICDVLLYRRLSIPVKDIRALPEMDLEAMRAMLIKNEQSLNQKIEELRGAVRQIRAKQKTIERLELLHAAPLTVVSVKLPEMREILFSDEQALQAYIKDPESAAILFAPPYNAVPDYGNFSAAGSGALLRQGDALPRDYLAGLLRIDSDNDLVHNAARFADWAGEHSRRAGALLGRYLLSSCEEGRRYDYYEAWLELAD